jgi:large subunit ribosomal protein L31
MKKGIHPEWYPDAEVVVEGEVVMTIGSTKPRINVEIWSGTHPFYTGQQRLIDTEGQVDRFLRRLRRREEIQTELEEVAPEQVDPRDAPVSAMALDKRATDALIAAELTTVGDVLDKLNEGEDTLLAIQGVGQRALIDIRRYLRAEGLIE